MSDEASLDELGGLSGTPIGWQQGWSGPHDRWDQDLGTNLGDPGQAGPRSEEITITHQLLEDRYEKRQFLQEHIGIYNADEFHAEFVGSHGRGLGYHQTYRDDWLSSRANTDGHSLASRGDLNTTIRLLLERSGRRLDAGSLKDGTPSRQSSAGFVPPR